MPTATLQVASSRPTSDYAMDTFRFDLTSGLGWVYLLCVAAAAAFAYVTYRGTVPDLLPSRRWILTVLRTLALAMLVLTLFEPVVRSIRSATVTPSVTVLVDGSSSAVLRDVSRDRRADRDEAMKRLTDRLGDRMHVAVFDDNVRSTPDSLGGGGVRTDIGRALQWAANRSDEERTGAVVLLSDGNSNTGVPPAYEAGRIGMPVFAAVLGDPRPPADIVVSTLLVPPVGYVGAEIGLSADIDVTTKGEVPLVIELLDNGTVIERRSIVGRGPRQRQTVAFTWKPTEEGIRKVTVRTVPLADEFSAKNNTMTEFVKIRPNKRRVAIVAGAPGPDVTFIRNALDTDPDRTIASFVQKPGGTYYEGTPTDASFRDLEALVLVGFPTRETPTGVIQAVAAAAKRGTALLFVASATVDYQKARALDDVLPFTVAASRPTELMVTVDLPAAGATDPVMRLHGSDADGRRWQELPPIYRTETFVRLQPGSTVLARQRINGVAVDDPLIVTREHGNGRSLAVLGYGIFRWKLLADGPTAARGGVADDLLTAFIGNGVRWLRVRDDQRPVRIRAARTLYASGERVDLIGTVRDASEQPVDDAEVSAVVRGPGGDRTVRLASVGGGRYTAAVDALPSGDYRIQGTAVLRGTTLGQDDNRFSVGDLDIEQLAISADTATMGEIGRRSGGASLPSVAIDRLIDSLEHHPAMMSSSETSAVDFALWSHPWLLGLALLCFSLEWFLRKRSGLV